MTQAPETCNSPDSISPKQGSNGDQAVNVALDPKAFDLALKAMNDTPVHLVDCDRCKGKGFHHGFGEDGCDPDWCGDCGGGGCVPAEGEETRPLKLFLQTYLAATAPALPQDVAKLIAEYRPSMPTEVLHLWAEDAKAALTSQSATIASAREVIDRQWKPVTCDGKFMTCPLPADETVVEVMLQDGKVCPAWYSCNIMEMGDFDFMPVTADGEPDDEAESIADKVIAWRAAREWKGR